MEHNKVHKLVVTALLAALTTVATMIIKVPTPVTNGFVNLGDVMVLVSGWILGPAYGFFAGGVGSAMADLISGYMTYVPGTLLIKGCMSLVAWVVVTKTNGSFVMRVISGVLAEIIMVFGYFAYESTLLGYGLAAAASIPANAVQGVIGLVIGLALYGVLDKSGVTKMAVGEERTKNV